MNDEKLQTELKQNSEKKNRTLVSIVLIFLFVCVMTFISILFIILSIHFVGYNLFDLTEPESESVNSPFYYVATSGNNNNTGLSLDYAWKTPSYAVDQVEAGDTIYLLDGIWEKEELYFKTNGTVEKPITLKAYNGTPILDGVDNRGTCITIDSEYSNELEDYANVTGYINIEGIKITRYSHGIEMKGAHHINFNNIDVGPCGTTTITFYDSTYCNLKNSNMHDTKWNTVVLMAAYTGTHNITIENCTIHGSPGTWGGKESHNLIDLFNVHNKNKKSLTDVNIIGNEIYDADLNGIFTHGLDNYHMYRFNISNNIIHNNYGVTVSYFEDSIIANNTLYDQYPWGFYTCPPVKIHDDVTFIGNNVSVESDGIEYWLSPDKEADILIIKDKSSYFRVDSKTVTIQDNDRSSFVIESKYGGKMILQFTDGREFSENGKGTVEYYSDYSEYITNGDERVDISTN